MKKIAIISELSNRTMNYGNRLQSYALNKFLLSNIRDSEVVSLMLNFELKRNIFVERFKFELKRLIRVQKMLFSPKVCAKKIKMRTNKKENSNFDNRLKNCQRFTGKLKTVQINSFQQLKKEDYDTIVVGSDIVWKQSELAVDRLRFLDFELMEPFKKFSYAASFGEVWIPKHNKRYIKNCLDDFDAISVREKSSVELLKGIGVENVVHVCDPTLLLTVEEWSSIAEPIEEVSEKYIFVYLLGKDVEQRKAIKKLAEKHNLKIATIPHADGIYDNVDDKFGDYQFMDASPGNWVWLIKNAEYIITDSFHGSVFSTIFSKNFIVTKRHYEHDINVRMTDFLDTIGEEDKFVDITTVSSLDDFVWDYKKIAVELDELKISSKKFLLNRKNVKPGNIL